MSYELSEDGLLVIDRRYNYTLDADVQIETDGDTFWFDTGKPEPNSVYCVELSQAIALAKYVMREIILK